jgi:hypothetical protein
MAHQQVTAFPVFRFRCPDCNWEQLVASPNSPPVTQCPWCGWTSDLGVVSQGAFAVVTCPIHGQVVCLVIDQGIRVEDYISLFCPHCSPPPAGD